MNTVLNAANVLASVAGTIAADTATGGIGSAISGALSMNEVLRRLMGKTPALNGRIAADLQTALDRHHLTDDQKRLIPQMIERAPLTPAEIMVCARQPDRITAAMLAKMTDPAHTTPVSQDAFTRVLRPVLTRLLGDEDIATTLRPAFENAVAESLSFLGEQVETLTRLLEERSEKMGVGEALLRTLARRFAPGSEGDLLQAHADLEQALEAAQRVIAQGTMPSNLDAQVQATLAEVARLMQTNHPDDASALVDRELARLEDEVAERNQARSQLHQTAFDLARTQNNPTRAATHILARLALETHPDPFEALREEQDRWYVSGRDKGLAFDLDLSIALAEALLARAQTPNQRGNALNDLGISLSILGTRQSDPAPLRRAVSAYEQALLECTRDCFPLYWAVMQTNLGNALTSLGDRQSDPALLQRAVTGYEQALLECTRYRVPLNWALTQNNLGNTLVTLGERQSDPALLQRAVTAYEQALLEYTRDLSPLGWAMAQNNLGTALASLAERQSDPALLQRAVNAYDQALLEWTQDRVPLDWAMTQNNLALLDLAFHRLTPDPARLIAAKEKALAARQVFQDAGATAYLENVDRLLSQIDAA